MQDPRELDGFGLVENTALQPLTTLLELILKCDTNKFTIEHYHFRLLACQRMYNYMYISLERHHSDPSKRNHKRRVLNFHVLKTEYFKVVNE